MKKTDKTALELIQYGLDAYIPNISVDCVILGYNAGTLKILLCKLDVSNNWMLPGGFILKDEDDVDAAHRILETRTSLRDVYLRQFAFFGKKDRRDKAHHELIMKAAKIKNAEEHWLNQRFVSLGYYALIDYSQAKIQASEGEQVAWFDVKDIPLDLFGDHYDITQEAHRTIRNSIGYIPVGYKLLPEKFTMPELRSIYETILERELDRRNFQRKMLSIGLIEPLNETRKEGAYKSPNLYRFNIKKYEEAEKNGTQLMTIIL